MMFFLKRVYRKLKKECKLFVSVNWIKTVYFNFKMLPFKHAKKLPFYFYGKVTFTNLKGSVVLEAPIIRAMIGFGQQYEKNTKSKKIAEINFGGHLIFKGYAQFGKDYFIYVKENAICEIGNMASMGSGGKLICAKKIVLRNYARIGAESQVMDSNFHEMIDTVTGEKFPMVSPIIIGNYNYIGNRVSIMSKTITPDYCTIASNSLCNRDYSNEGENILIGGFPAKLIRKNISRDWKGEEEKLHSNLKVYKK